MNPSTSPPPQSHGTLACDANEGFAEWMCRCNGVVAITTYQAGKVVMVGWNGRQVSVLPRDFDKAMGLAGKGQELALATRNEVIILGNAPMLAYAFIEQEPGRYDALFLPRATYHTTELSVHDIAFGSEGLWLVVTRFSCLATLSTRFNFVPRWRPPFISEVCPEDRCHLNGLAMADGQPKYVTALGQSDVVGGWREGRIDGGLVMEVPSGEIVARNLSMPHSPRMHDGMLWVLNSGAGELLQIDPTTGHREVVCVLPGYLRGLTFAGGFALVGLGTVRDQHLFSGLPVGDRFPKLTCGVAVVELGSDRVMGIFEFTSGCTELYDVLFLPGISRPMILNVTNEQTDVAISAPGVSYWLRPSSLRPNPEVTSID